MATIAEMFIDIGADASQFEREADNMQQQMKGMQSEMRTMADSMGTSTTQMARDWRAMSAEMKEAMRANTEKMKPFKQAQQEVQYGFFKMAQGMKDYKGTTSEFMSELNALGKQHKIATENMLKNNDMAKQGFIQSIAVMMNRSTQAEKIIKNYERMGNPLYSVNNGLLSVAGSMNKIAMAGQPARLALEMLGPNANMKDLRDMTMMINQGLMRFAMVSIIAGAFAVAFYSKLNDAAKEAVPAYKKATEELSEATKGVFSPMAELFGTIMTPIVNLITHVAGLAKKFNEAHPVLAKIIQGFLMLIPILTFLLSPLAIGIGLFGGIKAALAGVWMLIGPVVTGFAAMMGTVLIVAAALTLLGVALWALWTKTDWFKDAVIGAWNAIKKAAVAIWNYIYTNGIKPAIDAIYNYVVLIQTQLLMFWMEHGEKIKAVISILWTLIKGIFKTQLAGIVTALKIAFEIMKTTVSVLFQAIKTTIDIVLNTIGGLFKFWMSVFKGDWQGAFEALKGIVTGNLDIIVNFIKGLGQTFFNAGKGLIEMMADGIKSAASAVVNTVKDIAGKIRDFLPFSPAKEGPLSDLDKLDFGGPIADSLHAAIPRVKGLMGNLLTVPDIIGQRNAVAATGGDTYHLTVELNASDLEEMQSVYDFFGKIRQEKRARG